MSALSHLSGPFSPRLYMVPRRLGRVQTVKRIFTKPRPTFHLTDVLQSVMMRKGPPFICSSVAKVFRRRRREIRRVRAEIGKANNAEKKEREKEGERERERERRRERERETGEETWNELTLSRLSYVGTAPSPQPLV